MKKLKLHKGFHPDFKLSPFFLFLQGDAKMVMDAVSRMEDTEPFLANFGHLG